MGECTPTNYLPPDGDDRVCQHFRRKICWWVWACDVGRCTWTNSTILSEAFTSCVDKNDNYYTKMPRKWSQQVDEEVRGCIMFSVCYKKLLEAFRFFYYSTRWFPGILTVKFLKHHKSLLSLINFGNS